MVEGLEMRDAENSELFEGNASDTRALKKLQYLFRYDPLCEQSLLVILAAEVHLVTSRTQ